MPKNVRVRFAPSPTGALHIGGLRTALYNYLFAKKHNGKFILRIEDTDQTRYIEEAEDYIKAALKWCNIQTDESPEQGGDFAPYKQSERKELYQKYVQQMIDQGTAYYAFDTGKELDAMREALQKAKAHALSYNSITRMRMKNSLTLSPEAVRSRLDSGEPYVVRMKIMAKEDVRFTDMIRGTVKIHTSALDDKILMKSDGMPTYHLANVVDDYLMKITHVIRGEEWLPSTPLHLLLYRYLGWEKDMPKFAHLPLLLKPEGQGKLSKRDAEKQGFPIFPMQWSSQKGHRGFKEEGYLSEALVNFLALLGWNPGTADEIFTMEELISQFALEQVNKSGVKFDIQKALWFNRQYIRALLPETLAQHVLALTKERQKACEPSKAPAIAELLQERIDVLPELLTKGKYFFEAPEEYAQKVVRKKWNALAQAVFQSFVHRLDETLPRTAKQFQEALDMASETHQVAVGQVMPILRVALTGEAGGPDLTRIMEVIGTQEVKRRIVCAQAKFPAEKA